MRVAVIFGGTKMSIAVVGMLDEREEALSLIRDRIEERGHKALLIDISIGTGAIVPSLKADIGYGELSALGGGPSSGVAEMLPDGREEAISIMAGGLAEKIMSLHKGGGLEGMIAIAGMTGAMISASVTRVYRRTSSSSIGIGTPAPTVRLHP